MANHRPANKLQQPRATMPNSRPALQIALIYAGFSITWILVSDTVVEWLFAEPAQIVAASIYKGWAFVALTTLLLFGLLRRWQARIQTANQLENEAQKARSQLDQEIGREREQRQALTSHYATLIEKARDIVLLLDDSGNILDANQAALTAYGWSQDEFTKLTIHDLRAVDSLADIENQWQAAASEKGTLFEARHCRRDGSTFPVEVSASAIVVDGKLYRQSFVRDISERKAAESDLKDRQEELERFNRASVGRELDMIELKRQINALSVELGREPPFDLNWLSTNATVPRQ